MKCYKIPTPIEYKIFTGDNIEEIEKFAHSSLHHITCYNNKTGGESQVLGMGNSQNLYPGDTIIRYSTGSVRFVNKREFDKYYKIVEG